MIRRRRRSHGPGPAILVAFLSVLILAGAGWWWFGSREAPEPPSSAPVAVQSPAATAPATEPIDLPPLEGSDDFVRGLVGRLSAHPQLTSWLVTDELVRRFVGVVVDLAGGLSPAPRVEFLIPEREFVVRESGESILLDPAGYRRYDLLTDTFVSLDTSGSARLYHELHPLFEAAYEELGIPDQNFDDAMTLAVDNLLAAEVPAGPFELRPNESIYEFRDVALEARSPAEKHLIRMGPENAERFQAKLAELWMEIGARSNP